MEFPAAVALLLPKTQLCTPNTAPSSTQSYNALLEGLHVYFLAWLLMNQARNASKYMQFSAFVSKPGESRQAFGRQVLSTPQAPLTSQPFHFLP